MAYSKNTSWINDQIRARNIVAYKITDERKNTIAENEQLTPDVVISELEGILPNLSGLIYLQLSPKNKAEKAAGGVATKQDIQIPIQLSGNDIGNRSIGAIPTAPQVDNSRVFAEMEERFNAKIELLQMQNKHAMEIAELRRELAEAKEVNPTLEMVKPMLPQIISGIFGGNPIQPMAGINGHNEQHQQVQEVTDQEHGAAEDAITRLLAVDPDFINVLCRLAKLAETNIDMYKMAKGMLPEL